MAEPLASVADGAPADAERELTVRAAQYVQDLGSELEEADRWLARVEADQRRRRARARKRVGLPPDTTRGRSRNAAPFRRLNCALRVVLSEGREWIKARGIGAAELDPDEVRRRTLWERRAVYVYWLLFDPESKWRGEPYRMPGTLTCDRASALEFLPPLHRQPLTDLVKGVLDRVAPLPPPDAQEAPGDGDGAGVARRVLRGEALDSAAASLLSHNPAWSLAEVARNLGVDRRRLSDPNMKTLALVRERIEVEQEERRERYQALGRRDALSGRNDE